MATGSQQRKVVFWSLSRIFVSQYFLSQGDKSGNGETTTKCQTEEDHREDEREEGRRRGKKQMNSKKRRRRREMETKETVRNQIVEKWKKKRVEEYKQNT